MSFTPILSTVTTATESLGLVTEAKVQVGGLQKHRTPTLQPCVTPHSPHPARDSRSRILEITQVATQPPPEFEPSERLSDLKGLNGEAALFIALSSRSRGQVRSLKHIFETRGAPPTLIVPLHTPVELLRLSSRRIGALSRQIQHLAQLPTVLLIIKLNDAFNS